MTKRALVTGVTGQDRAVRQSASSRFPPYLGVAMLTFCVQFALMSVSFPLREVLSEHPLFHIDAAYHWYNMKLAANLATTGQTVGYDPYFSAGHVNGIHYYLSGRFVALLAMLLSPPVDEIVLYKIYVFASGVLAPLAIVGAAAALFLTPWEALIAALLGIFMFWVSYLHWYDTAGMVGYVTTTYLGILFVALIIRFLERGGSLRIPVGLGLFGAFCFYWHPIFPVPVAFGVAGYLAAAWRRIDWRAPTIAFAIIATLSLLPNLTWLYAMVQHHDGYAPNNTQNVVGASPIGLELFGLSRFDAHGSKVYPLLFLAALWACVRRGDPVRRVWIGLMLSAIALQLYAYLAGAIPAIGRLQPNRIACAGYLLLCVPAARGLATLGRMFVEKGNGARRTLAGSAVAAALLCGGVLTWEVWREVRPGPHGRYGAEPPEVRPLGDYSNWMIRWLSERTTPDARVLFENSLARVHDSGHMAGYYAYRGQREFIGGPYPFMHFASAWDAHAFGKRLSDIPVDRMHEYLSLYNIGWIVVHSDAAKRYFDAMPGVSVDATHGVLRAYRVDGQHSYLLRGSGHVQERAHNHVLITDLAGPEVVLKYHYVPGLVTDPPANIDGVYLLDDPKPFVRIRNPPSRLRLTMREVF